MAYAASAEALAAASALSLSHLLRAAALCLRCDFTASLASFGMLHLSTRTRILSLLRFHSLRAVSASRAAIAASSGNSPCAQRLHISRDSAQTSAGARSDVCSM